MFVVDVDFILIKVILFEMRCKIIGVIVNNIIDNTDGIRFSRKVFPCTHFFFRAAAALTDKTGKDFALYHVLLSEAWLRFCSM